MNKVKSIALVEWNWTGHHPTYFSHFVLALEELGVNVLAICPSPENARKDIDDLRRQRGSNKGARTVYHEVPVAARRFHGIRPARIGAIDWSIRYFRSIERIAKECQPVAGGRPDLVFYACMYDRDFEWIQVVQRFLSLPWSGLYLHALSFRMPGRPSQASGRVPCPEKMFNGRLCRGIAILDEGIVEKVSALIGKPVVAAPDLTDERTAAKAEDHVLGRKLKQFAAGRPIVGLFGHLQKSKGILTFLEAARLEASADICFAVGGDIIWPHGDEADQIRLALAECPNVWNHLARIRDGEQMNSVLAACDILFAGYLDFPHSSNIMTKAALLAKPLIVSDGYLMAERVRRFNMGEIIPQGNTEALLKAILKITKDPTTWKAENKPQWAKYCQKHSFERLKACFTELFSSI